MGADRMTCIRFGLVGTTAYNGLPVASALGTNATEIHHLPSGMRQAAEARHVHTEGNQSKGLAS